MTLQALISAVDQQIRETGAPVIADWDTLKTTLAARAVLALSIDRDEFEQFVVDYDAGDRQGGMFVFADAFIRKFQPPGAVSGILTMQGRYTAEATIRYLYGLEKQ
jgi:hypothetical protein